MMKAQKPSIALSRALFELRNGRAIGLDGEFFQPIESDEAPQTGRFIAPASLDERFKPEHCQAPSDETQALAIHLLKRAGLLPIAALVDVADSSFTVEDIKQALQSENHKLTEVARAKLPLKMIEQAEIISFRSPSSAVEHLAVVVGNPQTIEAPLVRVHSSCLTGDLLGSLRCDCGDQLQLALRQIAETGHGVLCYLQQEGRGIGISNKIRAYQLQDEGLDTLDANLALGFDADERDFGLASAMLKALDIATITLLSNNPDKVEQLTRYDVTVQKRESLITPPTDHNADYLATKQARFGHEMG